MKDLIINDKLLETISTYKELPHTLTGEGSKKIVFGGLTHHHLLQTNKISNAIKEYYVSYTKELLTTEASSGIPEDYHSNIFQYGLSPFILVIFGAYHSRHNLFWKVIQLLNPSNNITLNGNANIASFYDLKSYFSEYAIGFENGYQDFEKDKILPFLPIIHSQNQEAYALKLLEFLSVDLSENPRTTTKKGFSVYFNGRTNEIVKSFQDGLMEGYIYRAWSIIFSNNLLFAPFFKEHRLNGSFVKKIESLNKKEDILKMQNHLIPKVSLENVYEHFSILTKPTKEGKIYLTEQKLLIFIESTFVNKNPIKQSFDEPFAKIDIRSVFKRFQDNCVHLEYNQTKIKEKYYKIMNNAFKGFSKPDRDHWLRTNNKIKEIEKQKDK